MRTIRVLAPLLILLEVRSRRGSLFFPWPAARASELLGSAFAPVTRRFAMRAKNKALAHAILLVGLGSSFLYPQPSEFPLQPSKTVVATGVRWSMVVEPARCDAEGNVYVRQVLSSRRSRPLAGPVLQISADGQNTRTFDLSAVPDEAVKNGDIQDFAGGKDGVYLLVSTRSSESSRYELIHFKADGQYEGSVALPPDVSPFHFAVLPESGVFVVTGVKRSRGTSGGAEEVPCTFLVDSYGHLIAHVELPRDAKIGQLAGAASGTPDFAPVALGSVEAGDDGNAYLWRRSSPPLVYVLSPSGEVVRMLQLASPGKGFAPSVMKVANGRIVMDFSKPAEGTDEQLLVAYDAQTGEQLARYRPSTGGALACYRQGQVALLNNQQGMTTIIEAIAR
jgi:hypothetical protein